jgi:hypothetical protein
MQYRFFNNSVELSSYLQGDWFGVGQHANPALPEGSMAARLYYQLPRTRLAFAALSEFADLPWQKQNRHATYFWFDLQLNEPVRLTADYAHFKQGALDVQLQALEKKRLKLVARHGAILFAGVLARAGLFLPAHQTLWFFRRRAAIRSSRRANT